MLNDSSSKLGERMMKEKSRTLRELQSKDRELQRELAADLLQFRAKIEFGSVIVECC